MAIGSGLHQHQKSIVLLLTSDRARNWFEKVQIKYGRSAVAEKRVVANSAGLGWLQVPKTHLNLHITLNPGEVRVKMMCLRLGFQMQRFPEVPKRNWQGSGTSRTGKGSILCQVRSHGG